MTPAEVIDAARLAIDVALALAPVEQVRVLLDEQAVKRANLIADIAERVKFGSPTTTEDTP